MKRWIWTMLAAYALVSGLPGQTAAQVRDVLLAEAKQLNQQVEELFPQGRFVEATTLAKRALAVRQKFLGAEQLIPANRLHPRTTGILTTGRHLFSRVIGGVSQASRLVRDV